MEPLYLTRNRGKFLLHVHIVLVVKYRRKILNGKLSSDAKQYVHDALRAMDCWVEVIETCGDHIHILVGYLPTKRVSDIVKAIKQITTYNMWKTHSEILKQHFWKQQILWSDGYFVCSVGYASYETLCAYIKNQ